MVDPSTGPEDGNPIPYASCASRQWCHLAAELRIEVIGPDLFPVSAIHPVIMVSYTVSND